VGFAAGNNVGLTERDDSDYVALLNNDAFVEPDWLRPLVAALQADSGLGAATSQVLLARREGAFDVINNAGNVLYTNGQGADRGLGELDVGQYDEPAEVFAWCGCSALISRSYLDDVGAFDEDLFVYYEDIDLSWRGRRQGWRYVYVPSSVVRHLHTATSVEGSPLFDFHVERNRLIVIARNAPLSFLARVMFLTIANLARVLVLDLARGVVRRRKPDLRRFTRRARAFGAFAARLPGIVGERKSLRRRQTASDGEVMAWLVSP
jgi:GT2 family glycosyltransferase